MATTTTRKLTRAEACIQLALRIDPFLSPVPDFFTSRDAATKVVAYLKSLNDEAVSKAFFAQLQCWEWDVDFDGFYELLLATPEQITLTVCAALDIEVA